MTIGGAPLANDTLFTAIAPSGLVRPEVRREGPAPPSVPRATSSRTRPAPSVLVRSTTGSENPELRIRDRHDNIGPGQTATLRIDDFDLKRERTLIRGRFRASGARRILPYLKSDNLSAGITALIACVRRFLLAVRGIRQHSYTHGQQAANQNRGHHKHQLGVRHGFDDAFHEGYGDAPVELHRARSPLRLPAP